MSTLEKKIETEIIEYLKMRGIFCFKINSTGIFDPRTKKFRKNQNRHIISGVADILGVLPNGRFLAIEVKTEKIVVSPVKQSKRVVKTKASDAQKFFLANVTANGGLAFVATNIKEVEIELRKAIAQDKLPPFEFKPGPLL